MSLHDSNYHRWVNKIMHQTSEAASAHEKIVAVVLPDAVRWHAMKGDECNKHGQKIFVKTIASFAGISKSSVQRVLKQFATDGLIAYHNQPAFRQGYKSDAYIILYSALLEGDIQTSSIKNKRNLQINYVPSPCCEGAKLKKSRKIQYAEWVCEGCGQIHMLPASKKEAILKALEMQHAAKAQAYFDTLESRDDA